MANDITDWVDVYIQVETTPASGAFDRPCVFTTQAQNLQNVLKEPKIPACPPTTGSTWRRTRVDVKQSDITGSGFLYSDSRKTWRDWFFGVNGDARLVRWFVGLPLADGGGYYEASYLLENFQETSGQDDNDGFVGFEASLKSDGEVTWTDAAV